MNRTQRLVLTAIGIALLTVLAYTLLRPDEPNISTIDGGAGTERDGSPTLPAGDERTPSGRPTTTTPPTATSEPAGEEIVVRDERPVGGEQILRFDSGGRARFTVRSPEKALEIHVHGYDITRTAEPGAPARFSFDADLEGVFEVEIESSGRTLAELRVEP
ncbi:MAG: hypothetical protein ACR2NA_10260 [Solirubrobacterales bacterium]